MKTDSAPGRLGWRAWRIEDLHQLLKDLNDSGFVHVQARGELFLEHSEFLRKLTRAEQCFAHLDECADDEHADSRSPDRSPVSQTDNAVHPTASPHVVFI